MKDVSRVDVVVAATTADGEATFVDTPSPLHVSIPDAFEVSWLWETAGGPSIPHGIGRVPTDASFPGPGGTKVGLMCFPAHSSGKFSIDGGGDAPADPHITAVAHDDPGMHVSRTVDYEFIISGAVDIVLENGESRTLTAGSVLVMGGVAHAWSNHYDEPCIYAAVIIGAGPDPQ